MPRALDRRRPTADYDPLRSGTEFHWNSLLKDQSEIWQDILKQVIASIETGILGDLFDLLGTPEWLDQLFASILDRIGLSLPDLAAIGLDLTSLEALLDSLTITAIRDAVAGVVGSTIADIQDRLQHLTPTGLFDAEFLGNILNIPALDDISVPGVESLRDNIVAQLLGWGGSGWTHAQAAAALGQTADVGVYTSAQIEALWAAINTGVVAVDDFTRSGSTLSALWDEGYSPSGRGHWTTNGSNAVWDFTGGGDCYSVSRWIGANPASTGDYQTVTATLGTGPSWMFLLGNYHGANSVCGRMNAAKTHYIELSARETRDWELTKRIGGSKIVMASGTVEAALGPGTRLELVCGDKPNSVPRHFTAKVGTQQVASGVFGDTTSSFGAGFRGWGMGGEQDGPSAAFDAAKPGNVNQWIGQDTA